MINEIRFKEDTFPIVMLRNPTTDEVDIVHSDGDSTISMRIAETIDTNSYGVLSFDMLKIINLFNTADVSLHATLSGESSGLLVRVLHLMDVRGIKVIDTAFPAWIPVYTDDVEFARYVSIVEELQDKIMLWCNSGNGEEV